MPRLSDTMERGTIARWLVHEGDAVHEGDVLAEIETDKATMELNAYSDGVLLRILVQDGESADLGAPIAVVGAEGEDVSGFSAAAGHGDAAAARRSGGGGAASATAVAEARRRGCAQLGCAGRGDRLPPRCACARGGPAAASSRPAPSRGAWHPTPASTCAVWPARAVAPTGGSCASTSSARWPAEPPPRPRRRRPQPRGGGGPAPAAPPRRLRPRPIS